MLNKQDDIRVLVIGCGNMGTSHARMPRLVKTPTGIFRDHSFTT
jgi:threonine dehydrogenase-like Zn-dependent dehydrogenase